MIDGFNLHSFIIYIFWILTMKILNLNSNHCAAAAVQLSALDRVIGYWPDVITLQEPYYIEDKVAHIRKKWKVINEVHGRAAIIIINEELEFTVGTISDCIVAINAEYKDKTLSI
ncbi:hypothetical protein X975_00473, partial [Stegodyphus mimosarum]